MNNKNNTNEAQATKKKPRLGLWIPLIAAAVALAILATVLGIFAFSGDDEVIDAGTGGSSAAPSTGFVYRDSNIGDYITLLSSQITNLNIPGYDSRVDDVTEENVKKYIDQMLMSAAATEAQNTATNYPKKTVAIDYGDEVYLYILYVVDPETGERISVDYFNNAYMETGALQIGMGSFGDAFDAALIDLIPAETGKFETRTMGAVDADDVVVITYTVTETIPATEEGAEDKVKTHKNFTGERMELAQKDEALRNKILANYGAIGQTFTFTHTEDIDEDGEDETVEYRCVITAVVEEEVAFKLAGVKLPDDFFGRNPTDEDYKALNGKTLDFYINIEYTVPHAPNTWENMTLTDIRNTIGFEPKDTTLAIETIREQCIAYVTEQLAQSYDETVRTTKLNLIWEEILDTLLFDRLPEDAVKEIVDAGVSELNSYFDYYTQYDATFSSVFADVDSYAPFFFGYDEKEYEDYTSYLEDYYAPRVVKQQLLVFGIYKTFINDESKITAAYEEIMKEIIEYNTEEGEDGEEVAPTREEVITYYGADTLRDMAISRAVEEYLLDNNTVDFTRPE